MNRTIHLFLGCSLAVFGAVSCGKTNVRKLSNDWKVTYEEHMIDRYDDSLTDISNTIITETTATTTSEYGPKGSTTPYTVSGPVGFNDFTIGKDGTWSHTTQYWTSDVNFKTEYKNEYSGTWTFVGKSHAGSEDFRRNERVVFHTLRQKIYSAATNIQTGEQQPPQVDFMQTFDMGIRTQVFVVESSTKDELMITAQGDMTNVSTLNEQPLQMISYTHRFSLKQK